MDGISKSFLCMPHPQGLMSCLRIQCGKLWLCPRTRQRQRLYSERADRVKEYCREDRGAAGEGHCGLVKKPLLPDVHLNKELFPVAVYFFYSIFFLQPAATLTGKKDFVSSMTRETLLKMWDWISVKCPFCVAEFRVGARLTTNLSTGFGICALTGIKFSSLLNSDDWFQGPAANLSKL